MYAGYLCSSLLGSQFVTNPPSECRCCLSRCANQLPSPWRRVIYT